MGSGCVGETDGALMPPVGSGPVAALRGGPAVSQAPRVPIIQMRKLASEPRDHHAGLHMRLSHAVI